MGIALIHPYAYDLVSVRDDITGIYFFSFPGLHNAIDHHMTESDHMFRFTAAADHIFKLQNLIELNRLF